MRYDPTTTIGCDLDGTGCRSAADCERLSGGPRDGGLKGVPIRGYGNLGFPLPGEKETRVEILKEEVLCS